MTTTLFTLLRQPTPELQILSWSRQLKPVRFNEYTALRFLSNALRSMRNAQAPDCAPIDQLNTAFEGIYSLCLGSLYLHGLLPSGKEGYRALAIQLGSECLRLTNRAEHWNAARFGCKHTKFRRAIHFHFSVARNRGVLHRFPRFGPVHSTTRR